jgi:hypothetical protein
MSEPAVTPAAEPVSDYAAFEARENAVAIGETPPVEPTPEPTPAPGPDQDDEPEPEPVTEAAAPVSPERKISKRQEHLNALERKAAEAETARQESDRRAAELAERLKAVEARTPAAEPAAKPKESEFQPTRPKPTESDVDASGKPVFETYADFTEALTDWKLEQREAKAAFESERTQRATAEAAQRESDRTRLSAWVGRRDAFIAKHPDKADALTRFLGTLTSGTPIGDTIIDSEVGGELADYLANHQDEADRIARLSPRSALLALGKLTATFDSPTTHASAPAQPAAKTVTSAPAPPTTLASRSATPADPAAAALAAGDFEAWEAEENRRALAGR